MSYLNAVRLHFAGQFQANISTVNNDPAHFHNAAFLPSYQEMNAPDPKTARQMHGWFNPQGDAAFRLRGCAITSAWTQAGQVSGADPVLQCLVADSDGSVPAKLVDLDPEQQLVSTIWGLEVRICDAAGHTLLRGSYEPAAFTDIWDRAESADGDIGAGAMYQSVLTHLEWHDAAKSAFLTELQAAAAGTGNLSIKFMVDGLNMEYTSPDFMCGRIVGTIGPALAGEPHHLVLGRHFMPDPATQTANFFAPAGGINFCAGVVDPGSETLYLDLGNALSTAAPGGAINDVGDLFVGVEGRPFGTLPCQGPDGYATPGWYERTAGVATFPLDPEQLSLARSSPLVITGIATQPNGSPFWVAERPAATYLRADAFVFRMSPGDTVDIPVYATQWGEPMVGVVVDFAIDNGQLQASFDKSVMVAAPPPVGEPSDVLAFPPSATTDARGVAHLVVKAGDPGTPRWFADGADYGIDGQVYGIRPAFADPSFSGPVNQWDFVSFLVWSGYAMPDPVTWADVQPILQQYANLYPVMLRFLNLADHDQLVANAGLLKLAFSLPISDPNTMPVTRDLSPAKRQAILTWLDNPLPGEPPQRAVLATDVANGAGPASADAFRFQGGKAAAAARRLVHARARAEALR